MNNFQRGYFYLLSLSPILGFLFYFENIVAYKVIGTATMIFFFSGILFGFIKVRRFPLYLIPLLLLTAYYYTWDLYNGSIAEMGFWMYLYRNISIQTFFALLIIENTHFTDNFIKRIVKIFIISILFCGLFVIIQIVYNPIFFTPLQVEEFYERTSLFEHFNLGIFGYLGLNELDLSFIPLLSLYIGYSFLKDYKSKFIFIIIGGFIAIASNARSTQINFLIVLFQILLLSKGLTKRMKIFFRIGITLTVIVLLFFSFTNFDPTLYFQTRTLSESANTRIYAWKMVEKYLPENPWFGTGKEITSALYSDIKGYTSQIHVGYAAHLFIYGIVGSSFLFLFWWMILRNFYRTARLTNFYGSFFGFLGFLFVNLTLPHYFIFNYGILFLFVFDKYFKEKYQSRLAAQVSS